MSHPTHDTLLQAGLRLAEQHGLTHMSVNAIVAEAGVAKGTFYVHFPDRTAYLVALHQWFHDRLKQTILTATADLEPGLERLRRGALAYLDGCLQGQAVKALLLEARGEPAIAEQVQHRNADFARLVQPNFEAMGWPHVEATARLYVAMTAEAALIELESGRANESLRAALFQFVDCARS